MENKANIPAHNLEIIIGERVVLVPYKREHVPKYNAWLADNPQLARLVSTEPVSIEEEYRSQAEWETTTTKMIRIICDKDKFQSDPTGASSMVGDVNLFFGVDGSDNTAEINIMIADPHDRHQGYASEATILTCIYAAQRFEIEKFIVHILEENKSAIEFFTHLGFQLVSTAPNVHGEYVMHLEAIDLPRSELCVQKLYLLD